MLLGGRMEITANCRLAGALAGAMRTERDALTLRWLERIAARVALDPNRIFPTDDLLDHVPLLIDGVAAYLEDPAEEVGADMPVVAKAMELGELRFEQGFSAHQILKEYEILGGVLYNFLARAADAIDEPCTRSELLACGHRLFRAVVIIQAVTMTTYLRRSQEKVRDREEQLRGFNRVVSHELKNRIGVLLGAAQMLGEEWVAEDAAKRGEFVAMVLQNAGGMQAVLEDLLALSRVADDPRRERHVLLPEAAAEVARQLREMARTHDVEIRIAPDLPPVEINASAVELCLANYVSNAIKYADPAEPERWVEIRGHLAGRARGGGELVVEVADNGLGVPEALRDRLFRRFFRAHDERAASVEGTGLGLSIVRETVESLDGRAWARFDPPEGSVIAFSLPSRRRSDAARGAPPAAAHAAEPG
jgi:signal transduction histidine kinase